MKVIIICLTLCPGWLLSFNTNAQETRSMWSSAYSAGMMEAALGTLARENATSQTVKDFAEKEIADHKVFNEKLKNAAKAPMPLVMEDKHKSRIDKLSSKKDKEFDREYIDMVIKNHQDTIDEFENALSGVKDEELRNWIRTTLPVLKEHLESARRIRSQQDK